MIYIVLALLLGFGLFLYFRFFKVPKYGNMVLVTGGLKTGKTLLSVNLAVRKYRSQVRKWYILRAWLRVSRYLFPFEKPKQVPDKPLFYCNVPVRLRDGYVPLTRDLLLRNTRFVYGSVCYVCESSLVADSMSFRDTDINENLLLFNKLFAHETRGGYLFYDTQAWQDNHFAIKRCLSSYFYIHHNRKIPFFVLLWIREIYDNGTDETVNASEDVESGLRLFIVPKKYFRYYDRYAYSSLTDSLPVEKSLTIPKTLKVNKIVTFKESKNYEKK